MKIQRALFVTAKELSVVKYALLNLVDSGKEPADEVEKRMFHGAKKLLEVMEEDRKQ